MTQDIGARYSMWPKFSDVPTDVEAAVSLQDNYMYFFKGTSSVLSLSLSFVCLLTILHYTPINTVLRKANNIVCARRYYKFDETSGHVLPGYPKSTAGAWFGPQCNNGRVEPK